MDEKKRNDVAYKEGLINLKTYSKIMDKYGRKYKKVGRDLLS